MSVETNQWGQVKCKCEQCGKEYFVKDFTFKRNGSRFCGLKCWGLFRREKFDYKMKNENGRRICNVCKIEKNTTEFSPDNRRRYRTKTCKDCKNKWMKQHRKNNPEHYRNSDLKKLYGITNEQYLDILNKQNFVCAICKKQETRKRGWLHVDHSHRTGEVRGLLCGNCNTGIGKLGEDINILNAAIEYLKEVEG